MGATLPFRQTHAIVIKSRYMGVLLELVVLQFQYHNKNTVRRFHKRKELIYSNVKTVEMTKHKWKWKTFSRNENWRHLFFHFKLTKQSPEDDSDFVMSKKNKYKRFVRPKHSHLKKRKLST